MNLILSQNERKMTRHASGGANGAGNHTSGSGRDGGQEGQAPQHPALFMNASGRTCLEKTPQLTEHRKWYHSRLNALPREKKRKMFVDNELGESIPASDSEDEGKAKEPGGMGGDGGAGGSTRWSFEEDMIACGLYKKLERGRRALLATSKVLYNTTEATHIFATHHRIAILEAPEDKALDVLAYGSINQMLNRWKGSDLAELTQRYREHSTLPAALDSFENLFCYRCRKFDCGSHLPGMYILPLKRKIPPPKGGVEPVSLKPCGRNCFLRMPPAIPGNVVGVSTSGYKWTPLDDAILLRGFKMFGEDLCSTARLLAKPSSITCSDVRLRLLEKEAIRLTECPEVDKTRVDDAGLGPAHPGCITIVEARPDTPTEPPAAAVVAKGGRKIQGKKTQRSINQTTVRERMKNAGTLWSEYVPCDCHARGLPCDENCPCSKSGNFCERFCSCHGHSCKNRFMGCNCKKACDTKACPCFASGRECDPELCHKCEFHVDGQKHITKCKNMALRQLRSPCHGVRMGISTVSGMGAFLTNGAKKGDLIGEYTGEIITQQEADRRGKIYDRNDCSYLFNLNDQYALDAEIKGNKLRFANHSSNPNCKAKVMLVDGEHRVAIYARRDIPAGAELFYDYKYEADKAPEWARPDSD